MIGDPVSVELEHASVRLIRDTKLKMLADWEDANSMPGETVVSRRYDLVRGCQVARITVRSAIPASCNWGTQWSANS